MQKELDALKLPVQVRIVGVGSVGTPQDVMEMMSGRTLPWLLDMPDVNAETRWKANWRDVVILDTKNRVLKTYNLEKHSLATREHYDELLGLLKDAATR